MAFKIAADFSKSVYIFKEFSEGVFEAIDYMFNLSSSVEEAFVIADDLLGTIEGSAE